jgi:hypothetical protein
MKPRTLAVPVSLTLALLAGCALAPPRPASIARGDYTTTQAYITQLIEHGMAQSKVTGLSIALVDDQRVVWSQGFGYADLGRKLPATADTLYRVASISKLFTDTAAMPARTKVLARLCATITPTTKRHQPAAVDDPPQRVATRQAQGFSNHNTRVFR